jgi:hypothetical protein
MTGDMEIVSSIPLTHKNPLDTYAAIPEVTLSPKV